MDQFVWDEIKNTQALIMPSKGRIKKHSVCDEYVIFVNRSPVSWYFACAVMLMTNEVDSVRAHVIVSDPQANMFFEEFFQEAGISEDADPEKRARFFSRNFLFNNVSAFMDNTPENCYEKLRICTFLDASNDEFCSVEKQNAYLAEFQRILDYAASSSSIKLVHTETLPQIQPLPGKMAGISEREYEFYAAQFPSDSREQFVLKSEEMVRDSVKSGLKAVVSRLQNVYGPGVPNSMVDRIREEILHSKTMTVDVSSCNQYINLNHITFSAAQVHYMFAKGHGGHIYNLGQFKSTPYAITTQLFPYFTDCGVSLNSKGASACEPRYQLLCCKKAQPLLSSKYANGKLIKSIYKSIISYTILEYFDPNEVFIYDGKLEAIKQIELDMMAEIKRICDKHNIKYFLVGGSMLGAVRHKGFIPWDDDLDIGMLREDYDKFAQVAPGELDSRYYYQSHTSDDGSHYIFDKIRLKDTFFSTKFSDRFEIENGLFIDILVYDKTAKELKKQNRHIKEICIWSRAINVRWVNKARKNVAYRLSKLLLPVMRLVPFQMYHQVLNKILTRYNHTDSEWLIDGVGQNIRKGAFPAAWFDELIEVPFENLMLPIPKRYDEYLRHWYGDKYMQLLPISKRNSGHVMKRIDLGSYVQCFGLSADTYHIASRKGELYDENI